VEKAPAANKGKAGGKVDGKEEKIAEKDGKSKVILIVDRQG
jgi:hypothetical protein